MSFYKIKTQLFVLVFLVILILGLVSYFQYASETKKIYSLNRNTKHEKLKWINNIVDLNDDKFKTYGNETSVWDEFVNYIKHPNKKWFETEIVTGLRNQNIKADYTWVFNKDFELVDKVSISGQNIPDLPEMTNQLFQKELQTNTFHNYCFLFDGKLVQMFQFSIHSINDRKRAEKKEGYFFIARIWNDTVIHSLGALTNSSISIEPVIDQSKTTDVVPDSMMVVRKTLYAYDGSKVRDLKFVFTPEMLSEYKSAFNYVLLSTLSIIFIVLTILIIRLQQFIIQPTKLLSYALKTNKFDILEPIVKGRFDYNLVRQLVLLISSISIVFVIGLYVQHYIKINKIESFKEQYKHQKLSWVRQIISLNTDKVNTYLYEVTNHDKLIQNINYPNYNWFDTNIVAGLKDLATPDYAWIYNKDLELVYNVGTFDTNIPKLPGIRDSVFLEKLKTLTFHRYFSFSDEKLVEIFRFSIHPTTDRERLTPQQGHFFIANIWDTNIISSLEDLTNSSISIVPTIDSSEKDVVEDHIIAVRKPLYSYDGSTVADVKFLFAPEMFAEYRNIFNYGLSNILILIIIIVIFFIHFYYLHIKPINLLIYYMKTEQFDKLDPVLNNKTEISDIVKTIIEIIKQKNELSTELEEKTQTLDKLSKNETKYKSVFENINYGIGFAEVIFDLENKPVDYKFVEANNILIDFLKTSHEYLMEKNISGSDLALKGLDKDQFLQVALTGNPTFFEIQMFSRYLHVYVFPHKPNLLVGIFTDITDTKKYSILETKESHIEDVRKERMEILGQIARGITHDINNSLAPIVGYSDLLLKDENNSKIFKMLEKIKISGNNIKNIIDTLRIFYKEKTQKNEYPSLDFNSIVTKVVNQLEQNWINIIPNKNIEIKKELSTQLPNIIGSEDKIIEAVIQLMNNAYDAVSNNGLIHIKTYTTNNNVVFEIIDNGTGMDATAQLHCFDPFYTTKGAKNSGLGLTIVYHTMEFHNGNIEISSNEKGTSVKLIF